MDMNLYNLVIGYTYYGITYTLKKVFEFILFVLTDLFFKIYDKFRTITEFYIGCVYVFKVYIFFCNTYAFSAFYRKVKLLSFQKGSYSAQYLHKTLTSGIHNTRLL